MDATPPWDSEKRVDDDRPERVFWQSSQNPQRFLDRVMNEMGSLTSDSRSSSSSSSAIECVASAPSITTVTAKRKHFDISPSPSYSSYPVSVAGSGTKRSRVRSRRSLASRESTPQGLQRGNHTSTSSGTALDVDLDRITKLVKNVSQSLYSRPAPTTTSTTASSRTSQPKGQTKELHDTTNGSKSILESNIDGPITSMTARRSDSRPTPSSQSCRINGNKDPTSKNLHQASQESSQSRRGASPPPQFPKPTTSPPSLRPPILQSRSANARTLGFKGTSTGRSLQEVIAKPFKVPFAVADAKKPVGNPLKPPSITGIPSHPEPSLPPGPVASKREISSSSDSFEMDSFGDDHQAIEACLSQYD